MAAYFLVYHPDPMKYAALFLPSNIDLCHVILVQFVTPARGKREKYTALGTHYPAQGLHEGRIMWPMGGIFPHA